MKIPPTISTAVLTLSISFTAALAQDPAPPVPAAPPAAAADAETPKPVKLKPGVYDYQNLPIIPVLREISAAAKINLTITLGVSGNITIHVEGKTPVEAIQAIADAQGLMLDKTDGNYTISTLEEWKKAHYFFEAQNLPGAIAKYKKRYYDALIKEGFTKDEALKIITSEPLPPRDTRFMNN